MNIDKAIKENLEFSFSYVDLFYAFCLAKGIEDPEEIETDEEYDNLEKEFNAKITYSDISNIRKEIIEYSMKKINESMVNVLNK